MIGSQWRCIHASVAGTAHIRTGVGCQDASVYKIIPHDDESLLVVIASDGAGSAREAATGATRLCSIFLNEITTYFEQGGRIEDIERKTVIHWLQSFQKEIEYLAQEMGLMLRDFACTLLGAIIGNSRSIFFQIGDGTIVTSRPQDPDEYGWVFWPQRGEYVNCTYFATDLDAEKILQFDVATFYIDEVAILTDGLENLALHYQSRTVHNPFFRTLFSPLRTASNESLEKLTVSLINFLNSPRVNERTDDDKTLILATRRLTKC
ncbi:serine/threonine phosphoprotein phosphatase [Desulfofundulus kuznetsovii DSM 6115]|uniref:Serine/threonine phosphoprotein phosphatase n=1 Tax=Desulfofundulus kuznetsovii (strain DSM 6115 / VKM B-1805 / 17) TaxID=760568 RepID=A0AAU8PMZ1_DESK7|nr:serine/threonine phosphoprotein phosphatase [Desulfofundulus kuznetsovii DSM 6115]